MKKYTRLRLVPGALLFVICLGTLFYLKLNINFFHSMEHNQEKSTKKTRDNVEDIFDDVPTETQVCEIPVLDLLNRDVDEMIRSLPQKICSNTENWVEVRGSVAKINPWARKKFGAVKCSFKEIFTNNESEKKLGKVVKTYNEYNFTNSEAVKVFCKGAFGQKWRKQLLGIRSDQEVLQRTSWSKTPADSLKLNVMMLGFHALSHTKWKKKVWKTYGYATQELEGIAFNGYNVVGNRILDALIPLFTGKTASEIILKGKRAKENEMADEYPLIWKEFKKNGYATLYASVTPNVGIFTNGPADFRKQPVDHYLRPFLLQPISFSTSEVNFCVYQKIYKSTLNYVKNMFIAYKDKPKFIFTFTSDFAQDSLDYTNTIDGRTIQFLQEIRKEGLLNNTMIILISDNGFNKPDFINNQQTKQEERLPGLIIVLPSWFKRKYKKAYENLKINSDRLTTPFDVHEVLKNILHFEGTNLGNTKNRGISLFKEVPRSRSCSNAHIRSDWCSCLVQESFPVSSIMVQEAAWFLVKYINDITNNFRDVCAKLRVKKVFSCMKLVPNSSILKPTSEEDRREISVSAEVYRIKLSVSPGDMLYKASITYLLRDHKFTVSESRIKRKFKQKDTFNCVKDKVLKNYLRPYCYCVV